MASTWRVTPEPPCTASPAGLSKTITASSSCRITASSAWRSPALRTGFARLRSASPVCSGGMRICWPDASRVEASTRAPSTRTCPERTSFCRCPKPRPGKCSLNQRSSRMPASSRSTVRVSTAVMRARRVLCEAWVRVVSAGPDGEQGGASPKDESCGSDETRGSERRSCGEEEDRVEPRGEHAGGRDDRDCESREGRVRHPGDQPRARRDQSDGHRNQARLNGYPPA